MKKADDNGMSDPPLWLGLGSPRQHRIGWQQFLLGRGTTLDCLHVLLAVLPTRHADDQVIAGGLPQSQMTRVEYLVTILLVSSLTGANLVSISLWRHYGSHLEPRSAGPDGGN